MAAAVSWFQCVSRSFSSLSGGGKSKLFWANFAHRHQVISNGCDLEHWRIYPRSRPPPTATRDQIIASYVNTLAKVLGRYDNFLFGKCADLDDFRLVLPDGYKQGSEDYGGEPFINGKAVEYDPKYHEDYVRMSKRSFGIFLDKY